MRRVGYRKNIIKVALLYPSTNAVAMSSAVFHILYFKLQDEGLYVERFTLDKGPRGVEDGTPLSHFDYIVATVHYELDYVNLVKMLLDGGVEIKAARRERPKVVVGGPPVTANPEPLAEFVDAVAVGELEPLWSSLIEYITTGENKGLYNPAERNVVKIATGRWEGDYRRLPEPEAAFSLSVELARGCPFDCLFCMESYITKPYRPRDWREALGDAEVLYRKYNIRPALVALTANAHSGFKELLKEAARRRIPISLPSLRAELLDEETIELIAKTGQRTLTIAPETSQRLREALGKRISDADLIKTVEAAKRLGLRVKMYLMVGLPCETEGDLEAVVKLIKEIRQRGVRLTLSVNPFVPKPQTPLQYHPMAPLHYLEKAIEKLKRAPHDGFTHYDVELAAVQAAISLGSRDVGRHIEAAAREKSPMRYWRNALKRGELDYIFEKRDEPLPWSHVVGHYDASVLKKRYEEFLKAACG
ncbi:MAG: radical SAM protein [Pyrobaculum sp.]